MKREGRGDDALFDGQAVEFVREVADDARVPDDFWRPVARGDGGHDPEAVFVGDFGVGGGLVDEGPDFAVVGGGGVGLYFGWCGLDDAGGAGCELKGLTSSR